MAQKCLGSGRSSPLYASDCFPICKAMRRRTILIGGRASSVKLCPSGRSKPRSRTRSVGGETLNRSLAFHPAELTPQDLAT